MLEGSSCCSDGYACITVDCYLTHSWRSTQVGQLVWCCVVILWSRSYLPIVGRAPAPALRTRSNPLRLSFFHLAIFNPPLCLSPPSLPLPFLSPPPPLSLPFILAPATPSSPPFFAYPIYFSFLSLDPSFTQSCRRLPSIHIAIVDRPNRPHTQTNAATHLHSRPLLGQASLTDSTGPTALNTLCTPRSLLLHSPSTIFIRRLGQSVTALYYLRPV